MKRTLFFATFFIFLACTSESNKPSCEGITCSNAGSCQILQDTAVCICDTGYTGVDCEECSLGYIRNANNICTLPLECTEELCNGHGTCDDTTGTPVCDCDFPYDGIFCSNCTSGYILNEEGMCVPDTTVGCENYVFGASSFLNEILIEDQEDCCFDYNGDGNPDNNFLGLCQLFNLALGSGCNDFLAAGIDSGDIQKLLELHNTITLEDGNLTSPFFDGVSQNNDFSVGRDQFVEENGQCTDVPSGLILSELAGNTLTGSSDYLEFLLLPVPLLNTTANIPLFLHDVRLEAVLVENGGISVADGKLGGWTPLSLLFDTFNTIMENECPCLGLGSNPRIIYSVDNEGWDVQCITPEESTCGEEDHELCSSSFCTFVTVLTNMPDVDTDNDGIEDSVSVGVKFSSVPVNITGISME